jgi:predicted ArsR family transcriptional regulator
MLVVLKLLLEPDHLREILSEVAQTIASGLTIKGPAATAEEKAETAVAVLEELGGAPRIDREGDKTFVRSNSGCPFSEVVSEHPEICRLAETLLSEITGTAVCESCERGAVPRCSFEIQAANAA